MLLTMTIQNQKAVTINYTLKDDQGEIIDQSNDGSFCYLHGADNIIPGLENALTGKSKDEKLDLVIKPEDAYGEYNAAFSQVVEKSMFEQDQSEELQVGMQFHAQGEDGGMVMITISAIDGDKVTIDGNHPLAGITLHYDVHIVDVRDATEEELSHGHIHQHGESCNH
jgi:FKBP-type peptidyl-prolyl cis-trans isomerase SlyD